MSSISQVADALKRVLTTRAKDLERETEFVQRSTAQLDGPTFSQTTVFGWMDTPEASSPQLRHVAASLGVSVSSQAVGQRSLESVTDFDARSALRHEDEEHHSVVHTFPPETRGLGHTDGEVLDRCRRTARIDRHRNLI